MSPFFLHHWAGNPERPAMALHCMMGTGSYWGRITELLDQRIDLTAPDLLGHGRSPDWQPGELDYHTQITRAVAGMIDRPLDLIGHSFGATVALRIAVGAPEAVRSLTLIEPVLFAAASNPDESGFFARMTETMAAGDPLAAAEDFLGVWGLPQIKDGAPVKPVPTPRQVGQMGIVLETNQSLFADSARILRPDGLEGIDAPVLFITGETSPPVMGEIAEALASRMSDVGLAQVPGAGHMLPLSHTAEVAGLIAANLDRA